MAEQIILYLEISITENNLKKLLNSKLEKASYKKKVGYYFSQLLYEGINNPATLFILNFDKKTGTCFIAYAPRNFENSMIATFVEIFKIMSKLKNQNTLDYAIFSTSFPTFIEGYIIKNSSVIKISLKEAPKEIMDKLSLKFWSFSKNNNFPNPKEALFKRNYLYKNFKNYYKRYLAYIEECEKPNKIAQATKESPYHLFDEFYTYNNKVFQFRTYPKQVIEIPQACPLTLRTVAGIIADKNHVFLSRLTKESPLQYIKETIGGRTYLTENPNAIWEYYIFEQADGESFNYVKEKWDTVYWKDNNSVFIFFKTNKQLKKLEQADSNTFEYLNFCYGKDKNHLFFNDSILPIHPANYTLNKNGFIFDDKNIFHYQHQIPLDAKTFQVLHYESTQNPFMGTFILEDKNGKYEYNKEWEKMIVKI